MLREIQIENEVATIADANQYFEMLCKKYGVECKPTNEIDFAGSVEGEHPAYVNITGTVEFQKSLDMQKPLITLYAVTGLRMMCEMSPEEMIEASDYIKGCARVAQDFNERMNGVLVVWE